LEHCSEDKGHQFRDSKAELDQQKKERQGGLGVVAGQKNRVIPMKKQLEQRAERTAEKGEGHSRLNEFDFSSKHPLLIA
jgi:hypothetical protein